MKKFLLTAIALMVVMGAFAQQKGESNVGISLAAHKPGYYANDYKSSESKASRLATFSANVPDIAAFSSSV